MMSALPRLLRNNLQPGHLILLPWCANLQSLSALHHAECRVIAAHPKPLSLLPLQAACTPLDTAAREAALSALAQTQRRQTPLWRHLQTLYQTHCPDCGATVSAAAFLWQRQPPDPQQKYALCPSCGRQGWSPVTASDLTVLDSLPVRSLQHHFLLERVDPTGPEREQIETLQLLYPPRAIHALAELLIKLELVLPSETQRVFKAILLESLLSLSSLFSDLAATTLPPNLAPPARFVERNVWQVFEAAVQAYTPPPEAARFNVLPLAQLLAGYQRGVSFVTEPPEQAAAQLPHESLPVLWAHLPAPHPLLDPLETLWAGWLLGPLAAQPGLAELAAGADIWSQRVTRLTQIWQALWPVCKAEALCLVTTTSERIALAAALAALAAGFEVEVWEMVDGQHQLQLLPRPPHTAGISSLLTVEEAVQREVQAVRAGFSPSVVPAADGDVRLVIWQSLLYSGLLAALVQHRSATDAFTWLWANLGQLTNPPPS